MRRPDVRGLMSREAWRHAIASTIAGVLTSAAIIIGVLTDVIPGGPILTSLFVTLLFGLYGPLFLLLSWLTFRPWTGTALQTWLTRSDEKSRVMRWLFLSSPATWAATVIVVGIVSVVLLTTSDELGNWSTVIICVVGVTGTWVLMVAVMAIEYMRSWANEDSMRFPGDDPRSFTDFLYVSIQLSTTFSSADVSLTRRGVRGLASLHSVLAFAYSTAIIAVFASLLISTTSG